MQGFGTHNGAVPTLHTPAAVFAHQGGWDELLLVGGPILIIGALLMVANKRAKQLDVDQPEGASPGEPETP